MVRRCNTSLLSESYEADVAGQNLDPQQALAELIAITLMKWRKFVALHGKNQQ